MLLFNDEPVALSEVAPELFEKKGPKGSEKLVLKKQDKPTIRFVLHSSQKDYNPDLKIYMIPAGKYYDPMLMNFTHPGTGATGVLRYCDSRIPRPDGKGGTIYSYLPDHLVIDDRCDVNVPSKNAELLFLWRQLPMNAANAIKNNETPVFYEEDKVKEATNTMDIVRMNQMALTLIVAEPEQGGLDHDELRMLAKVLYMSTADEADIVEVRAYLADIAKRRPQDIVNKHKDPSTQLKAMVRDAEKFGIIKYKKETFSWVILENGVREVSTICRTSPGKDPVEYLIDYMVNHDTNKTLDYIRTGVSEMKEVGA